jgi:N-acetylneuraminate lyase
MHNFTLIAAPFTPFHADLSLNLDAIEPLAAHLIECGVDGVFICGTTGEGYALTGEERKAVAQRWVELRHAHGLPLRIIAQVGHAGVAEARALAAHAQSAGVDGIAAVPPYFMKPSGAHEVAASCAAIAEAAPQTPFFYYHIPSQSGVSLEMAALLPAARKLIPTFAGLKFTHEDIFDFGRCLDAAGDELELLFGRDEILTSGLAVGARGAVGATYNFAAPQFRRMLAAWEQGDIAAAQSQQMRVREWVAALRPFNLIAAAKHLMAWLGVECGPCRPPLPQLSPRAQIELRAALETLHFQERVAR